MFLNGTPENGIPPSRRLPQGGQNFRRGLILFRQSRSKSGGNNCHRRQFMLMTVPGARRDASRRPSEQSAGLRGADRTRRCLLLFPTRPSPSPSPGHRHPGPFNPTMATPSVDPPVLASSAAQTPGFIGPWRSGLPLLRSSRIVFATLEQCSHLTNVFLFNSGASEDICSSK